jgi:glc operon protein GlcG
MTNFGDLRYTGWGGGVPLEVDGVVVGAVGVSGLPEADDMRIAAGAAGVLPG